MDALLADNPSQRADVGVSLAIGDSPRDLVVVRRRVRELLAGYPEATMADAVCLVDALASNAYDHGATPKAVRLILLSGGGVLRVEADDASVFALPVMRGWSGRSGLGMLVVTQVAASWGVERHPARKTIWAEMQLEP